MSCKCADREFFPYLLIITRRVGEFHMWPLDQLVDAKKEFKRDKVQILPFPTIEAEAEFASELGPEMWDYIHEFLHLIPSDLGAMGGRLKIEAGSGESLSDRELSPEYLRNFN